jgi:hypothetical protein
MAMIMRKMSNSFSHTKTRKRKGNLFVFWVLVYFGIFFAHTSLFAQTKLTDLRWMLGTWQRETAKSFTYETWRQLSDRTFEGESFRVSKATGDTVFAESLLLAEMAGEIFYLPKVAENKYPVPFKLISFEKNKVVFENPGHDFPQRIIYVRNSDGAITVYAGGRMNGEERQIEFQFQKVIQ